MSLAITNTSPRISRLVARLQAQSSYWLAWVLLIMHMNVNTVDVGYHVKWCAFSSCRLLFEHLNVAVAGWGWATMSFFWMGSRAYVIFSNGVARWKRLGTTALDTFLIKCMKFVTYKDDTLVRAIWDTVFCALLLTALIKLMLRVINAFDQV